ncbi:MAG: ankyrin repeat domain-containing protein [Eubacteriales bacterium]|nr:ankyrin repeat domain-containing protein [Eubacteriales bacterium]
MNQKMDAEIMKAARQAIRTGDLELLKKLFTMYNDLFDAISPFGTWLHVAVEFNKMDIVKYLIDCGMDVNRNAGISGGNSLHNAACYGNLEIVKLLYKNGAKFDVSEATKNPLFGAIYNGHLEIAKFLVENGIDITASYSIGTLENVDAYEYARQFGQLEIAEYLKEKLEERQG